MSVTLYGDVAFVLENIYCGNKMVLERGEWVYRLFPVHSFGESIGRAWFPVGNIGKVGGGNDFCVIKTRKVDPPFIILPPYIGISCAGPLMMEAWWCVQPPSNLMQDTEVNLVRPYTGERKTFLPAKFKEHTEPMGISQLSTALWCDAIWLWNENVDGFWYSNSHRDRRYSIG